MFLIFGYHLHALTNINPHGSLLLSETVITLLGIAGLAHKQAYKDIFAITILKTGTCFLLIGLQSILHFV